MAELEKPITTQEEFDTAIKDRLERQAKTIRGEYADYEELKKKSGEWQKEKEAYEKASAKSKEDYAALNTKYQEATGKIAAYEADALKTKIAIENKLPLELRGYLKGSTEEEIKASAEELGKFAKVTQAPPLADPEGNQTKGDEIMKKLLKSLKGE